MSADILLVIIPVMFFLLIIGVSLAVFAIWVISLIHVMNNDVENRALWIVLILGFGGIAAVVYYYMVRKPFEAQKKSK